MAQAIVIEEYGPAEVLKLKDMVVGKPGRGQLKIRHTRIGVNFHDTYVRSGLYKTLSPPGIPGIEAVGVVEELGEEVEGWDVGDRVAYVTGSYGVYTSERLIDASLIHRVPDEVSDNAAASALLRGITVDMLLHRVGKVSPGDTILVQAAAGGVGRLLCQWASHLGAQVIGTVSNDAQAEIAMAAGCAHPINYKTEDVVARVDAITDKNGVSVAFDGVGKESFNGSLQSLGFFGHLVNFGQSSGAVPNFELSSLAAKSNSLSRPIIFHYVRDAQQRTKMVENVWDALLGGWLKVSQPREIRLSDAAESHRILEAEGASTPLLLVPE